MKNKWELFNDDDDGVMIDGVSDWEFATALVLASADHENGWTVSIAPRAKWEKFHYTTMMTRTVPLIPMPGFSWRTMGWDPIVVHDAW